MTRGAELRRTKVVAAPFFFLFFFSCSRCAISQRWVSSNVLAAQKLTAHRITLCLSTDLAETVRPVRNDPPFDRAGVIFFFFFFSLRCVVCGYKVFSDV